MVIQGYPICRRSASTYTAQLPHFLIPDPLTSSHRIFHLHTSLCRIPSLTLTPTLETPSPSTPSTLLTPLPVNSRPGRAVITKSTVEFPTTTDRGWFITSRLWIPAQEGWEETSKEDLIFFCSMDLDMV